MASSDMSGQYMASRNASVVTPAQRFRMQQKGELSQPEAPAPARLNIPESKVTVGGVAADIGAGVVEAPRQIFGGVRDAAQETLNAADSLGQSIESFLGIENIPTILQFTDEEGNFDLDLLTRSEAAKKGGLKDILPTISDPRSTTGALVRGVAQFLTGFIGAGKALKGVETATKTAKVGKVLAQGAIADAIVFDPHEDRLSNLTEEFPLLQNPVSDFLATEPDDTEAEGRFKNALEGLALGGLTESLFHSVRGIRANRIAKREQNQLEADRDTAAALVDDSLVKEGEPIKPLTADELKAVEPIAPKPDEALPSLGDPSKPMFSGGKGLAGDADALNINLSRINTTDDVKNLIEKVAEKNAKAINAERREVITQEETVKLADDLGMTVGNLLDRRRGEAFNAEQAVAARKILVASGENLIEMAKKAATGTDEEVTAFRRAMSQHSAIQSQVSGLTAEAGRALQSFRIQAGSDAMQARAIKESLDAAGGGDFSRNMAAQIAQMGDAAQVNKTVKNMLGAKTKDMLYEAWINGLLSSPATHTVNVLSNSIVAGWAAGERKVASMIGKGLGDQSIPDGEVSSQLKGMVEGTKDGMRLAWKVLKTGEPSDELTKIETQGHRSITAENLNLSGTPGRFADFVGETVRVPGRMLTAGDELFKTIGYRMELNAQAYRTGYNEGLRGDELSVRMNDIINNPPENLHIQAIDASRYQTFTQELGEAGKSVQSAVRRIPGARIIVPFIRTPTNIMKYVGERTPLAPLAKGVREDISAGGARRDVALAKIATGSMIMAAAADYTLSGQVTGGGPKNPAMRNLLRTTGWQPYSIRVGDDYFAYSRLDPVGALIGISADMSEIMGQVSEAEALDLATAAAVSVAQNVTSKTYLRGVSEFFDVMSSVSSDPEANNRKIERWIERMAGSVVPAGVAQLERTIDPALNATQGILEKIQSRIPGYSEDLPPRRNIFGEPIVLSGGLGPDIMSPIYMSTDKKDPIADEIVSQQTLLRMPLRAISGVELDSHMYDRYITLYSGKENRFVDQPLKSKLAEAFRTPSYQNATDGQEGGKSVFIRAIFEAYRETAKQQLIEENPELRMSIMKLKTKKVEKLTGVRQ